MMNSRLGIEIAVQLSHALNASLRYESARRLSGGDISPAYHFVASGQHYFVKLAPIKHMDAFSAEAEGLEVISACGAIRCPRPIIFGQAFDQVYLILEYISLSNQGDESLLASAMAKLHAHTATHYGWHRDNALGRSPQDNHEDHDWTRFWRVRRLEPQLRMARQRGAPWQLLAAGERLLRVLPQLLDGHTPPASLLHGDLWYGNRAFDNEGKPVIFDPAVYYGDREADLAMCALFGGFNDVFWNAYTAAWALPAGYQQRRKLYMLYHVLNHFNLFGGGYAQQALHLMNDLVRAAE